MEIFGAPLAYCKKQKATIMQMAQKVCNVTFNIITYGLNVTIYNADEHCKPKEARKIIKHCKIIDPLTNCSISLIKKTYKSCKKFIPDKVYCPRALTIENPYKEPDLLANIITTIKQVFQLNCNEPNIPLQNEEDKISSLFERMVNENVIINDEPLNDVFDYHTEPENDIFNVTDVTAGPLTTAIIMENSETDYTLYALCGCILCGFLLIGTIIGTKYFINKNKSAESQNVEEVELQSIGSNEQKDCEV